MEYWVVYDLATGEPLYRGSGSAGMGAVQVLPDGTALIRVPQAVVQTTEINLDLLRAYLAISIDNQAEQVRGRFITALPGQVGAYLLKANAARRWLADNSAPTWMLQPEATSRGMSLGDLCAEVLQREEDWERAAGPIEGLRLAAKAALETAVTLGAIVEAAKVDWSALTNG